MTITKEKLSEMRRVALEHKDANEYNRIRKIEKFQKQKKQKKGKL